MRNHADIVCITETWLTNYLSNLLIEIDNYSLVRKDRNVEKRGGGVFGYTYIRTDFHVGFLARQLVLFIIHHKKTTPYLQDI